MGMEKGQLNESFFSLMSSGPMKIISSARSTRFHLPFWLNWLLPYSSIPVDISPSSHTVNVASGVTVGTWRQRWPMMVSPGAYSHPGGAATSNFKFDEPSSARSSMLVVCEKCIRPWRFGMSSWEPLLQPHDANSKPVGSAAL